MPSSKVNHDIRSNQGRTIYMPEFYEGELGWGNLAIPSVYAADDTVALYPRGTRLVQGERVFYYGKALGTIANGNSSSVTASIATSGLGGQFFFTTAMQQDYADGLLVRKVAAEDKIWYNTTTSEARADDFYSGGWVCGKDSTGSNRFFWRRIVQHLYYATGADAAALLSGASAYTYLSSLLLDQPVINSKTAMATTIMNMDWKNVVYSPNGDQYSPAIGAVCTGNPTATYNQWYQTWGPMFNAHIRDNFEGADDAEIVFVIYGDGSVNALPIAGTEAALLTRDTKYKQIAGHSLANTAFEGGAGADEGLPMIYVTLRR